MTGGTGRSAAFLRGLALDRRREVLPRTLFRLPSRLALVVTVASQCIA